MKIEKEKLDRLSKIVKKHVPKVLTPEGVALMVLECTIGPKIAMLRLKGYSDEEIINILEKEEA